MLKSSAKNPPKLSIWSFVYFMIWAIFGILIGMSMAFS